MDITYTARPGGVRVTAHAAGGVYSIHSVEVADCTPRESVQERSVITLDGTGHSVVDRVDTIWQITTDVIDPSDWDDWRELSASAGAGDAVIIHPGSLYGLYDMQSPAIVGYIDGGVQLSRVGQLGHFRAAFSLRERQ